MMGIRRLFLVCGVLVSPAWLVMAACLVTIGPSRTAAEGPEQRGTLEFLQTEPDAAVGALPSPQLAGLLFFAHTNQPLTRRDLPIGGATSCAAAGCHGGPRPGVVAPTAERGSEYSLWYENDPHARSWRTICSPQSVAMMQRLRIIVDGTIRDQAGFDNCLACHNTTRKFDDARSTSLLREGVGCAACHGPDAAWIDRHYRRDWHPHFEIANGFVPVEDLFVRARMCASCHIGDADRDLNHDIIAAGHPPLRYEFATYHGGLPKHWRDAEAGDATRFEAQLWLAGQIAALDASLMLLESRAEQRLAVSRWPELAEYDCASCHHQLLVRDRDESDLRSPRRRPVGMASYSSWHRIGVEWLLEQLEREGKAESATLRLQAAVGDVQDIMQSKYRPDPVTAAAAARTARQALDAWIRGEGQRERADFDAQRLVQLAIQANGSASATRNWESAAQFYLAAVAGRADWPAETEAESKARRLRRALVYPSGRAGSSFPFDASQPQRITLDELRILVDDFAGALRRGAFEIE